MRTIEASEFRNLVIENGVVGAAGDGSAPSRGSIEFLCGRALADDESMCIPIAVSEFSLADLVGHPHLLERIERRDGGIQFRYELSGPLYPHR